MLNLTGLEELTDAELKSDGKNKGERHTVHPDLLYPDPDQPRKKLRSIPDMAASLKENGQLQPIIVYPADPDGRHKIFIGERRWRGAQHGKLNEVWISVDPNPNRTKQLVENIQREDLLPFEIADSIVALMESEGLSQKQVCERTGKSKSWVSRYVKIAEAPDALDSVIEKFSDYTALSTLVKLYEEKPEVVLAELEKIGKAEEIGREDVEAIALLVKGVPTPEVPLPNAVPQEAAGGTGGGQEPAGSPGTGTGAAGPAGGQAGEGQKQGGAKATPTEKNKEGGKGGLAAGAAPKGGTKDDPLADIYAQQLQAPGTVRTVLEGLGDEQWLKVHRMLKKEHASGALVGMKGIGAAVARRLSNGELATAGAGLYLMLAFIEGATSKSKFDDEEMRARCFDAAEAVITQK